MNTEITVYFMIMYEVFMILQEDSVLVTRILRAL